MSSLVLDRSLLTLRPGRLAARIALGIAVPLVVIVYAHARAMHPAVGMTLALFIVFETAAAVASWHKEVLAASTSFFHRGLRRQVQLAHTVWALGEATVATAFIGLMHPDAGPGGLAAVFGLALVVHALAAWATLRYTWTYLLPATATFTLAWLMRAGASGRFDAAFNMPQFWLPGGALSMWLLWRYLGQAELHRRLYGTLALSAADFFRPSRIREHQRLGGWHRRHGQGPQWRAQLIGALITRADKTRRQGRRVESRVWQFMAYDVAVSIGPRKSVHVLVVLVILGFMAFAGYYDACNTIEGLDRWFGGLVFQFALFPVFGLGLVLLSAQNATLSRRTAFASETATVGILMAATLLAALLIAGSFAALAAVLPPLAWHGTRLVFTAPRPHGMWLAPMLVPLAWLTVAVRPRAQRTLTDMALGPLFILGHAFLNKVPYHVSVPVCVAVSFASFMVAFSVRRRWWERADIIH